MSDFNSTILYFGYYYELDFGPAAGQKCLTWLLKRTFLFLLYSPSNHQHFFSWSLEISLTLSLCERRREHMDWMIASIPIRSEQKTQSVCSSRHFLFVHCARHHLNDTRTNKPGNCSSRGTERNGRARYFVHYFQSKILAVQQLLQSAPALRCCYEERTTAASDTSKLGVMAIVIR